MDKPRSTLAEMMQPCSQSPLPRFYQPGACETCEPAGPKIALRFPHLFVCAFTLITCAILHHATAVYYYSSRFWRLVGQDTASKYRIVLPRWRESGSNRNNPVFTTYSC